ncbi:MAG: hypothetical protein AAF862_12925 [Pseudomonadota bacterium]
MSQTPPRNRIFDPIDLSLPENVDLAVLRREMFSYIDLHDVFYPAVETPPEPLVEIAKELEQRLTGIIDLARHQNAASIPDAVHKLDILSAGLNVTTTRIAKSHINLLLQSIITDLKQINAPGHNVSASS